MKVIKVAGFVRIRAAVERSPVQPVSHETSYICEILVIFRRVPTPLLCYTLLAYLKSKAFSILAFFPPNATGFACALSSTGRCLVSDNWRSH